MKTIAAAFAAALSIAACGGGGSDCHNACPQAGATQCSGAQVQTCTADARGCLAWSSAVGCGADHYCSPAQNACVACNHTCAREGATLCSGNQAFQRCTADVNGCRAMSAATACPAGETCDTAQNACVTDPRATCGAPHVTAVLQPSGPPTAPSTCQRPIVASAIPAQVQDGGIVTANATADAGATNHTVEFDVPADAGSFSIVFQAVDAGTAIDLTFQGQDFNGIPNSVFPLKITGPDGGIFFDANAPDPQDPATATAWYPAPAPSTGTFTVPNTSATLAAWSGGAPAGKWTATVDDFADYFCNAGDPMLVCKPGFASNTDTYQVSVITRPGTAPLPGSLDVGFYIVTGLFGAASAESNPSMQRMISSLQQIYARAGICLRNVTLYDVPAWARTKYATGIDASKTGPCDELDQMFTLSQPLKNELNIFMVDAITQPTGGGGVGTVVGIDGSIPGPSTMSGTVHSGAVVNASDLTLGTCGSSLDFLHCGADELAYIVAHEGGHWMGLYHTTEAVGSPSDPLSDTGSCACASTCVGSRVGGCSARASPRTVVTGPDCNKGGFCDGSQSLMFWLLDRTSVGNVSSHQGQVMRLNPVVQ